MRRVIGGDWDEVLYEPEDGDEGYRSVTIFIDGREVFDGYAPGEFGWTDSEYEAVAWEMYTDSPEFEGVELDDDTEIRYVLGDWDGEEE